MKILTPSSEDRQMLETNVLRKFAGLFEMYEDAAYTRYWLEVKWLEKG